MRPPAFDPAALGGMPHWFSPPAFAKPEHAAPPPPMPAAAPSDLARSYSKPHADVFTVPPVPAHRRATAQQAKLDSSGGAVPPPGDPSSRIDVSHLAALSAVPDAALSARLAAAARLQREQLNAASHGAPRAALGEPAGRANHDANPIALPQQPALPACGAPAMAAPPAAAAQQAANITTPAIPATWLLDSLTVDEFVSLRSSRERELSSRELVDFTFAANSLESTLLEDASRLNLTAFNGLAGLLDAL